MLVMDGLLGVCVRGHWPGSHQQNRTCMFSAARNRVASTHVGTQRSSWAALLAMSGGDEPTERTRHFFALK